MRSLLSEIRRRKVHRAAVIYVVGGYAAIEAADLLAPLLQLPDWSPRLVLGLVLVGFPLAMAIAWIFEITPAGLERTPEVPASPTARTVEAGAPVPERPRPASAGRTSILVAPMDGRALGEEGAFIADGLTDEVITDLSRIASLRVISRASSMRLKDAGGRMEDNARDLGVDYVLQGSVRRAGDDLRITLQLLLVETGEACWSERYTGSLGDLFKIHDEVARSVADALPQHVGAIAGPATARRGLDDPRAVESYLRARYETWKFSEEGLSRAERHLLNALDIVGPDARLFASLGHAHAWYAQLGLDPDGEHLRRAAECADRVFELDPESSRGHWLRGLVRFHSGDLRGARGPLERAMAGNPNDPDTLMMLGYLSGLSGQLAKARDKFDRAVSVDPLTPLNNAMPGFLAVLEGRFADAVPYYRKYKEMDPDSPFAAWCWLWSLLYAGEEEAATDAVAELGEAHADSLFTPLGVGLFEAVFGDGDAARAAIGPELRAAARTTELFSRELAHCLALAGETDEALDWLENTIRIGNVNHPYWSTHDVLIAPLRSEPRFRDLMAQVEREWRSLNPELARDGTAG